MRRDLDILVFAQNYPLGIDGKPNPRGGLENSFLHISERMRDMGHRVRVISAVNTIVDENERPLDNGIDVVRIPILFKTIPYTRFLLRQHRVGWAATKRILDEKPDVVLSYGHADATIAAMLTKAANLPHVVSIRGNIIHKDMGKLQKNLFPYIFKVWQNADRVVFASEDSHQESLQCFRWSNTPLIIPNGVNHQTFGSNHDPSIVHTPLRMISTNRLIDEKGIDHAIEASVALTQRGIPHSLSIYGDGPDANRYQKYAATRAQDVTFFGHQNQHEIAAALADHDVFLLPSKSEGNSNSLLEAMTTGLGVVATRVGAAPALLDPEGGFFVDYKDVAGITSALEAYALQPELVRAHKMHNHRKMRQHPSWSDVADQYLELFHQVIAERKR